MGSKDINSILEQVNFETPMFKVSKIGIEHYKDKIKEFEATIKKEEQEIIKSKNRAIDIIKKLRNLNTTDEELVSILKSEFETKASKR